MKKVEMTKILSTRQVESSLLVPVRNMLCPRQIKLTVAKYGPLHV